MKEAQQAARSTLLEMKTFAITVSALALLSGILAQGSFGHTIVVMSTLLFIGVPLTLFLVLWLMISLKRSGRIPSGWRKTSTISAMLGGGLILSRARGTVDGVRPCGGDSGGGGD